MLIGRGGGAEQELVLRCGGALLQKQMRVRGGGGGEQVLLRGARGLLAQEMLPGGGGGGLQEMLPLRIGRGLPEEMLLRRRARLLLEQGLVVSRLRDRERQQRGEAERGDADEQGRAFHGTGS